MKNHATSTGAVTGDIDIDAMVSEAWETAGASFERFCVMAGISSLQKMMREDATELAGRRYERAPDKPGHRRETATGMVGFHGGKVAVKRPRVRDKETGRELPPPGREEARDGGLLEQRATTLMLMNVPTRTSGRAVRLPEAAVPAGDGSGLSKSAVSRRFKALTQAKFAEWMSSYLSELDLLMIGAIGVDGSGRKHPLGVVEGATENAAVVRSLPANPVGRGPGPEICRLFVVDGAKAPVKAIRRTFGADTPIRRCRVHKGRNIVERLPGHLHGGVRRTLRQARELEDAAKAERLLHDLARRLKQEAPGVSGTILEGLDEILTVTRLGLPPELRRSLACTNMIESLHGVVRQVCRNVKRWRNARMALRWTGAGMLEAEKGLRRLKACRQLPILKTALENHRNGPKKDTAVDRRTRAA